MLDWIKSLSWIVIAGAIGTAILLVLNAVRASRLEDRANAGEQREAELLNSGITGNLVKASALQKEIAQVKDKAAVLRAKAETQLEKLSESDNTMADIADRFNKRKLRDQAGGST